MSDETPVSRPTRIRWKVLAVLVAMSFVGYVLRTNMSIVGESMMRDLGLSQVQLGMILGAFAWGYALFQIPGGAFGDAFGGRRSLTWVAILLGVLNLSTGLLPGVDVFSLTNLVFALGALRFLVGVTQAPLFPVMGGRVIGDWFPLGGRALPNGLSSSGLTLGAAAAGPLIAWLAEAFGWRASFISTAPLAFATAALWWWYGRDRPAEHPSVNEAELALIQAGQPAPTEGEPGAWKLVLRDRNVLLLTVSYFCMNYVFYIFFNWFFVYLVQVRGFAAVESGFLATLPWLVGAVGATGGGLWCDGVTKSRGIRAGCRVPAATSLVAVALLLWAGAAPTNPYIAIALLSLCFGCTQLTEGAYWAAAISIGGRHAAAASGVMNTGGNIVGGIGAVLVPIVAARLGWIAALGTGSLFALVGAGLWLLIRADEQVQAPRSLRGRNEIG